MNPCILLVNNLTLLKKKLLKKTPVSKIEKPLIDLPSQDGKLKFKTSLAKTLEIVEKMLSDLKIKIEVLLEVHLALFQEMIKKLFLMKV